MQVDIFYETGFDIINIPCNPELLYDSTLFPYKRTFYDVNIVQSDWLGSIILEDNDLDWNRTADYCIITDEDKKTRTCYVIDHYEMLSENTVKFYLILDPYNTAGGMEPVEQKTGHGEHQPMIVLTGSANRISVPLQKADTHEDFRQNEADTFFTLDEPFSPTQRLHMHYSAVPANPEPTPPGPTPTPTTYLDFRYPANNVVTSGTGFRRISVGSDAGRFALLGESGVFNESTDVATGGYYIKTTVLSSGSNTFQLYDTKSDWVEAMQANVVAALHRLKYQVDALPEVNRKFSTDLQGVLIPAIFALFDNWKTTAASSNPSAEYDIQITPHYVQSGVSNYLLQYDTDPIIRLDVDSAQGNPFSQTDGYWYRVRMRVGCCTTGTEYYDICEDGRVIKEA